MRNIAGICRRMIALAMFIGLSAMVCSGVSKRSLIIPACNNPKCCCNIHEDIENLQPSQLVSIRIMQLI